MYCNLISVCLLILGAASNPLMGSFMETREDEIEFFNSIEEARESTKEQKPLVLFFSAKWCGPCSLMKANTFPNIDQKSSSEYLWVKIDIDSESEFTKSYEVKSVPQIIVLNPENEIIGRKSGSVSAKILIKFVEDVVESPQRPPLTVEQISAALSCETEEEFAGAMVLVVTELAKPDRKDRDEVIDLLKEHERDCQSELIELLSHEKLAIRGAASNSLAKLADIEIEFDPFAKIEVRAKQISAIKRQLEKK